MMAGPDCPSDDDLQAFVVGNLPSVTLEGVAGHVEGCGACQIRVEELDQIADELVGALRSLPAGAEAAEPKVPRPLLLAARAAIDSSRGDGAVDFTGDAGQQLSKSLGQGPVRLDKFELLEELGAGSFGFVFKARDTDLNRIVALKVQRSSSRDSQEERDRFVREARNIAQLDHPQIVSLFETGETETGVRYLVTEFLEGETLEKAIASRDFDLAEAALLVAEIANTLQYAHEKGMIHRDVKPSNVLLDRDGIPHVADLGLALCEAGDGTVTASGEILGTPAYMSPEIAEGHAHYVDARSDVYSLGVVLYELIAGERPFHGNRRLLMLQVLEDEPRSPRRLNPRIPRDLETICLKAIDKSPAHRYSSAAALAKDLRRFVKGEPIEARPISRIERGWRWCRRNPLAAVLFMGLSLASLCGFWHLGRLSRSLVHSSALDSAFQYAELLEIVNDVYASEVVDRVGDHGIEATADYAARDGAIPLPATMLTELLQRVSRSSKGMQGRHYSDFPFRSRRNGGPRDEFGRAALDWLQDNPRGMFSRVQEQDGVSVLRMARPRIMAASCVECHNRHPDSVKTDWKVGDVRGVLEIIRPLRRDEGRIREGLRGTFFLVGGISAVLIAAMIGVAIYNGRKGR